MVRNNLKTKHLDRQEGNNWCQSLCNWSPCLTSLVSAARGLLILLMFPTTFQCFARLVFGQIENAKMLATSSHYNSQKC